jgi:tripartite-type tricarboxylate transporter receptor subunit TctC
MGRGHRSEKMKRSLLLLAAVVIATLNVAARAQDNYPQRPVRLVAPLAPGGAVYLLARQVAERMGAAWGQRVVVDNRPGASGHVGAELVARAPADGYTLMVGTIGIHAAYGIYRRLNYDPAKDLQPVTVLAEFANVILVPAAFPAANLREFIAIAKARPGQLNYGSAGPGSSIHMVTELFQQMSGTKLTHVPYKGSGPALVDLIGGQIQVMFENLPVALPHVQGGRLRPLAVTTARRSETLPEVPTVAESGVPDYVASSWFTIAAPRGVPAALVGKINADLRRVLSSKEAADEFRKAGIGVVLNTPAEAARYFASETEKWNKVIRAANIQLD